MNDDQPAESDAKQPESDSLGMELASVGRTIVFLRSELKAMDPRSAAAQLYAELVNALETVYRLERSD